MPPLSPWRPKRILTHDSVAAIRTAWEKRNPRMTQQEFCEPWAKRLGVTWYAVRNVIKGARWKHNGSTQIKELA